MREPKLAGRWTWLFLAVAWLGIAVQTGAGKLGLREEMGAEQFRRCGLHKLDTEELAALEAWFEPRRCRNLTVASGETPGQGWPEKRKDPDDGIVSFNQSSHRYHCPSCESAQRCTRNCVRMQRAEAIARGGQPCQTCGGRCPS